VTPESWSALHRLTHDEVFHYYLGDPCELVVATLDGSLQIVELGHDLLRGQQVQFVVPAGAWQGMKLAPGGMWALLGTTMAPGFNPGMLLLASEVSVGHMPADAQSRLSAYLP